MHLESVCLMRGETCWHYEASSIFTLYHTLQAFIREGPFQFLYFIYSFPLVNVPCIKALADLRGGARDAAPPPGGQKFAK